MWPLLATFSYYARKAKMAVWLDPLSPNDFQHADGTLNWLFDDNWCPPETELCATRAGSMDREFINNVVCHINSQARKTVLQDEHILLLVDVHSSCEEVRRTEFCKRLNIVAFNLPTNTTHKLQPCERKTNKVFEQEIRRTRDLFLKMSHLSKSNTAVKIKLALATHKSSNPGYRQSNVLQSRTMATRFSFHVIFGSQKPSKK